MDVPRHCLPRGGRPIIGLHGMVAATSRKDPEAIDVFRAEDRRGERATSTGRYFSKPSLFARATVKAAAATNGKPEPPGDYIPLSRGTAAEAPEAAKDDDDADSRLARLQKRTRELSEHLRDIPSDVPAWLEYAGLQDEFLELGGRRSAGPVLERKLSILRTALEHNPQSEGLSVEYFRVCEAAWETPKVAALWERVLAAQGSERAPAMSSALWREFIRFSLSDFSSFTVSAARESHAKAIRALSRSRRDEGGVEAAERNALDVYCSLCGIEASAGYSERATAMMQALVEFIVFAPMCSMTLQEYRAAFIDFWDSEAPRVGEKGSVGWGKYTRIPTMQVESGDVADRGAATVETGAFEWPTAAASNEAEAERFLEELRLDLENETDRQRKERQAEEGQRVGGGSAEESDDSEAEADVDKGAEDEQPKRVAETTNEKQQSGTATATATARIGDGDSPKRSELASWAMGEEGPGVDRLWLPVKAAEVMEDIGDPERVVLGKDLRDVLFHVTSESVKMEAVLRYLEFIGAPAPRMECTLTHHFAAQCVAMDIAAADEMLGPLCDDSVLAGSTWFNHGMWDEVISRAFLHVPSSRRFGDTTGGSADSAAVEFCTRTLEQLYNAFPSRTAIGEAWMIWESRNRGPAAAKDLAKRLLSKRRDCLRLWLRYGQCELAAGHPNEAIRVFEMSMSAAAQRGTSVVSSPDGLAIAYSCARVHLTAAERDGCSRAISALCSVGGVAVPRGRMPSPTEVVIVRRALEGLLKSPSHFPAAASCLGLLEYLVGGFDAMRASFESSLICGVSASDLDREVVMEQLVSLSWWHSISPRNKPPAPPRLFRGVIRSALSSFPTNPMFAALLFASDRSGGMNSFRLRTLVDSTIRDNPHAVSLALFFVRSARDDAAAVAICERVLSAAHIGDGRSRRTGSTADPSQSPALWSELIRRLLRSGSVKEAKQAFFRAVRHVQWSKHLWLSCLGSPELLAAMTVTELRDVMALIAEKELRLRTDMPLW